MTEGRGTSGTILLVEDDMQTAATLSEVLGSNGYTVWHAEDGAAAKQMLEEANPDLVVLDLMLPDVDGLVLCATLKGIADVPIVICSGTVRKRDTILGLKLGADDFIQKPFDVEEFEARIQAVLRRKGGSGGRPTEMARGADELKVGSLVVDRARSRVTLSGRNLQMTRTEFRILQALASRPDEILSRDELAQILWGHPEPAGSRAIDMHVRRLRVKLTDTDPSAPPIVSVRGFGYKLSPPEAALSGGSRTAMAS